MPESSLVDRIIPLFILLINSLKKLSYFRKVKYNKEIKGKKLNNY